MERESNSDNANAYDSGERNTEKVGVMREKPRRGATWTEQEVSELFRIWKKPEVAGILAADNPVQRRGSGTDLARKLATELELVGISRTPAEVRAKVKNLKGDYRKVKESSCPESYKYFAQMRSILDPQDCSESVLFQRNSAEDLPNSITLLPQLSSSQVSFCDNPVRIELELFDNINMGYQGDELSIPIEIDGGNIIFPDRMLSSDEAIPIPSNVPSEENDASSNCSNLANAVVLDNSEMQLQLQQQLPLTATAGDCTNDFPTDSGQGTPFIVITTSEVGQRQAASASETNFHPYNPEDEATSGIKRKAVSFTGPSKRRKTQHDIQDFLSKIIASTTEHIVAEIKASEKRFMEWEERKRQEDRNKEEKMFQSLLQCLKGYSNCSSPMQHSNWEKSYESARNEEERESTDPDPKETEGQSDEGLYNKLSSVYQTIKESFNKQHKDMERDLLEWEKRMEIAEDQHSEKLLAMLNEIISSVHDRRA